MDDIDAFGAPCLCEFGSEFLAIIGGVVEDLHFETIPGIVKLANCFDEAFQDVLFVEYRKLNCHNGKFIGSKSTQWLKWFAKPIIEISEHETISAVHRQKKKNNKITD
jgi:hypothetical protein